jgi:hypothetical protein
MGTPKTQFHITGTPDPNEEAFFTDIDQEVLSQLRPEDWPRTAEGGGPTIYREWVQHLPERVDQWGDYIYTWKRPLGEGVIRFFWVKNKTPEEAKVPFRETTSLRNHPWPPILYALVLIPDYTFLRTGRGYNSDTNEISEVVAPNHYVREIYVPGVNEGTKVVKREFFGPAKFDIPQSPVPVPTSVSYDVNGVQGRFPECLHPRIEISSTRSGIAQVVAGTVSEVGGALEGQVFPSTEPFEEWAPYIFSDTQDQDETGGWHRIQLIAIPPDPPDVIVQ